MKLKELKSMLRPLQLAQYQSECALPLRNMFPNIRYIRRVVMRVARKLCIGLSQAWERVVLALYNQFVKGRNTGIFVGSFYDWVDGILQYNMFCSQLNMVSQERKRQAPAKPIFQDLATVYHTSTAPRPHKVRPRVGLPFQQSFV